MDHMQGFLKGGSYVAMYNCSFEDLVENYDMLMEDAPPLKGRVQLILSDPPFNVRREANRDNAEYDILRLDQMDKSVESMYETLGPGGHVVLFCSTEQHETWKGLFRDTKRMVRLGDRNVPAFTATNHPFLFLHKPHEYTQGPRKAATLFNPGQVAVHAKKNGMSFEKERELVDWTSHNHVQSRYPAFKAIIDNVPRLSPGEQIRVPVQNPGESTTRTRPLRNEQKPAALLREIICRFSKPGDIVLDFFAGTYSTAVAALTLPKHRKFVGCENDKYCHDVASREVYRRFALYIRHGETDIVIPHKTRSAANFLYALHEQAKKRKDIAWKAPEGLPQYQSMPPSIVAAVAAQAKNPQWMAMYCSIPVHAWPEAMQSTLHQMDVSELLQADAAACGVFVSDSQIRHPKAGRGCFAARTFMEGDVIGHYFGTLVYHDLTKRSTVSKEYGEGILAVTKTSFLTNAFQARMSSRATAFHEITELVDGKKALFIVPPSFSAMRYINDARYLRGDGEENIRSTQQRSANVHYVHALGGSQGGVRNPADLQRYDLIEVRATRLINPGDELLGDYGDGYVLFHSNEYHHGLFAA